MKKSYMLGAVCVVLLTFAAVSANASLVIKDLVDADDQLVILDTDTNLEWLSLDATKNRSINSLISGTSGTDYLGEYGFHFASQIELGEFWGNAGVPLTTAGITNTFTPAITKLIPFLGTSSPLFSGFEIIGESLIGIHNVNKEGCNDGFHQTASLYLFDPGLSSSNAFSSCFNNDSHGTPQGKYLLRASSVPIPTTPVDLSGTIKTPDGTDICAMVLVSGQFMFSCNPSGVFSLTNLPRENDGTVKRQIYADGFFPKIDILIDSVDDAVVMTRSGACPSYNAPYTPAFVPGSAGKRINIAGKVLTQNTQTPICAMVLANGKHMFSCDGTGSYALNIPLDTNGQFKLQVYADGFAPTIQTFDEFSSVNDVRMARATECQ